MNGAAGENNQVPEISAYGCGSGVCCCSEREEDFCGCFTLIEQVCDLEFEDLVCGSGVGDETLNFEIGGIRDRSPSRGLGDVYKRQTRTCATQTTFLRMVTPFSLNIAQSHVP